MKKFSRILCLILFITGNAFAQGFWFGKTMTATAAEAKWGQEEFNVPRFKDAALTERGKMASALLRKKATWIGKSFHDVQSELGSPDGHYFSDMIPAYLIQVAETSQGETWQIVFLPDNNYKIKDVIIHRNYPR